MRKLLIASTLLTAAAVLAPAPSQAQTYPWCAQYSGHGGGGRNCGFTTYAQCMATVSGIGGFCERNSFYRQDDRRLRRMHRRDW